MIVKLNKKYQGGFIMRKIIFFLVFGIFLLSGSVYAENNAVICSTEIIDNRIYINGQLPHSTQQNQVSLLVGSIDNILYIDQVESSDQGDFQFSFKFPEGTPIGDYEFRIGNDAGADPYQGVIHYGEKRQFADMNISIDINQYVPTLSGSISCIADKSIILRIENITDNIIIAEDTIHAEDGAHEISYQLPSLLQAKAFNISVICNDDSSKQAELNLEIDSSVLLVSASGTIELSDGTSISMHAQSVNSNLIDKQIEFTDSRTLSATLPNIVGNSAYTITADLYEEFFSSAEEEETTITAAASVNENIVTVSGQISSGEGQELSISIKDQDGLIVTTQNCISGSEGIFSTAIAMPSSSSSGIYRITIENSRLENTFVDTFLFAKAVETKNIDRLQNYSLYQALKKARPTLDGNKDGIITIEELSNIKGALNLNHRTLQSIDGLQACTGISELYISNNYISDLSPITGLNNLKTLYADHNRISNITALPVSLERINLSNNHLEEMECLQFVENLTILFADHNELSSIDFLSGMSSLKQLTLKNNHLTDISSLSSHNGLVHVDVSKNSISDISSLSGKLHLRDVRLSHNLITDLTALPNVLYWNLYVNGNDINLEQISSFIAINKLY